MFQSNRIYLPPSHSVQTTEAVLPCIQCVAIMQRLLRPCLNPWNLMELQITRPAVRLKAENRDALKSLHFWITF